MEVERLKEVLHKMKVETQQNEIQPQFNHSKSRTYFLSLVF